MLCGPVVAHRTAPIPSTAKLSCALTLAPRQRRCCGRGVLLDSFPQQGVGDLPVSVERALADLMQLDAEAQRARNRLSEIDEQSGRLRTYVAVSREYERMEAGQSALTPPPTPTSTTDVPGDGTLSRRTANMAVELIEAKGQPIHTRDLLTQMAARGVTVGGANPVANLSGFLSRDKARLVSSRTYGWSLRQRIVTDLSTRVPALELVVGRPDPGSAHPMTSTNGATVQHSEPALAGAEEDPRDPNMMYEAHREAQDEARWLAEEGAASLR